MAPEVFFSPEAQTDLLEIYDYIAPHGGPERALAYVERVQATCISLSTSPPTRHAARRYPPWTSGDRF